MKIALIGATGQAGSEILAELSRRGHAVTAIVRHPEKVPVLSGVTPAKGDVFDGAGLAALLLRHDAVVSSVHFTQSDPEILIAAVKEAGVKRYLVVGGAGSLEVAPGVRLITTPEFPAAYRAEAQAGTNFLDRLRREKELDWTFLSPSALFFAGPRTGTFRLGQDTLLVAGDGKSSISFADFAIAMADEIEAPKHSRSRFTVGY
ncbi:Quinate/shikimate dehydrogenase [Pyrroloquinoline-quinone] [Roseomonas mucosa]|uniref:NADH-flavin reductase n=1 Tax=Roseomonas mucosa TaxID=207340 RepID=A0A379N6T1_9PROT|nr:MULTISPECIES: NAD(P)-dependent oxidoreductase [Roseomonas]MBS5901524.1 NAD(P)-dependent oxidoreductase [Acetobacteraceae bacterium]MCG7353654.1 NAD(P)-dependent oxidoreductase [Roseomonas mucosa]MCG7357944.1 NAD(P)-dependent oxidoreductase [Roseomonas mucosa]MDT8288882.1 NAD(P)-dependent oxidoreductase [Roseomonas mucosa]MDT8293725.1 NAD(P)-dependent oxidoreductase [Roseomonas mucosa]